MSPGSEGTMGGLCPCEPQLLAAPDPVPRAKTRANTNPKPKKLISLLKPTMVFLQF